MGEALPLTLLLRVLLLEGEVVGEMLPVGDGVTDTLLLREGVHVAV